MLQHARGQRPLVVGADVYNITVKDEGYAEVLRSLHDEGGEELRARAPGEGEERYDPVEVGAVVEGGDAEGVTLEATLLPPRLGITLTSPPSPPARW